MSAFKNDLPVYYASCPGRLDVMGGIADYSGSLLLQMPLRQTTKVALQKREDNRFFLQSGDKGKIFTDFSIDAAKLEGEELHHAGAIIRSLPGGDWAVYVIGCFLVLQKQKGLVTTGATIQVSSTIPPGKGVASSAALEIAVLHAICKAYDLVIGLTELAILAQQVENSVAGAPCGLMDQLSANLGEKRKLLPLICQPCFIMPAIHIPEGIDFCGIDSGIRHSVGGASYNDVRTASYMGFTIIAKKLGVSAKELNHARTNNRRDILPFNGFLANIPVDDFNNLYAQILPESISGQEFIKEFEISIDTATSIEEGKNYSVRACSTHPVYENERVNKFLDQLIRFPGSEDKNIILQNLGELMYESHAGYSSVGLGNHYTDIIVQMIREAGPAGGVYGARVSGGGSGGTVVILCFGRQGRQTTKEIFHSYRKKYQKGVFFFQGSSHGAAVLNSTK